MLVSILAVGVVCWLKGDLGNLALAEGGGGNVQGKLKAESCEVSNLHDPEDPGSRSPRGQSTWGHSAFSPLLWLSLLGVCCRTTWVARALRGPLVLPQGHGRPVSVREQEGWKMQLL